MKFTITLNKDGIHERIQPYSIQYFNLSSVASMGREIQPGHRRTDVQEAEPQ